MVFRSLLFAFAFLLGLQVFATHNRAGEITYKWLGGLKYQATVTTYTKETAPADRCEITIDWGDNSTTVLPRTNGQANGSCGSIPMGQSLGNDAKLNIYIGEHTYQAPGYYTLSMQDPNRNAGVANIPNSVQTPFYISTLLNVNPALGANSSPSLLNPPLDDGCQNRRYVHNPGAWDPDGDSLSYSLINCRGLNGTDIPETYSPNLVQDPVTIDAITGDFIWDVPKSVGQYNFAMVITEHRKGPNGVWQIIGSVTRDMQLNIYPCANQPPQLMPIGPFCVVVGDNLQFTVQATDPDNDPIQLTATGGPLQIPPVAQFQQPTNGLGAVQQPFSWTPGCDHVQRLPWTMSFRVEDNPPGNDKPLVDYMQVEITVIAPAPENPVAVPTSTGINLSWDQSICDDALGYYIYRRDGFFGYTPDSCETGVPEYTGYKYLTSTTGLTATSILDTNDLKQGVSYCYMVTAYFPDGAESQASEEECTEMRKTKPILTNVDVISTSTTTGEMFVRWIPPREIDTLSFPPPYVYALERADGIDGTNFTEIATTINFSDTTFTDSGLNTQETGYRYRVGFYSGQNNTLVGYSDPASSVFLDVFPFDMENRLRFQFDVPWENDRFVVYKESSPGLFDSLTTVNVPNYVDTGLVNGQEYCYKVKSIGRYSGSKLPEPLINNSQIACAEPLDTTAPCPPNLTALADCEANYLKLTWTNPSGEFCSADITGYNIFYKRTEDEPWPSFPLATIPDPSVMEFEINNEGDIVGCYAITAYDDVSPPNESPKSDVICVDGCPIIVLPNVFSPNASPPNDYFHPVVDENGNLQFKDIESFTIEVFNRWGSLVYTSSSEADFVQVGWDGTDMNSGQPVAEGVYFYVFTYQTKSVVAHPDQVLQGNVTIFR